MALGVIPETKGMVIVPENVVLKLTMIENIIAYHRATPESIADCRQENPLKVGIHSIPPLVDTLRVWTHGKSKIRSVIVVEHKNVSELLKDDEKIQDSIVVLSSGYPSLAVCEFLHMLGQDKLLAKVPFLYVSDYDFQGFHQFSIFKYGCRNSSWASEIQTCPKLKWDGPRGDDYEKLVDNNTPLYRKHYILGHPRHTEQQIDDAVVVWRRKTTGKLAKAARPMNKTDHSLLKGFEKAGWLEREPDLADEIESLRAGSNVCPEDLYHHRSTDISAEIPTCRSRAR